MNEYKGKYERKPADPDGMVDKELVGLGINFTDLTEGIPVDTEYEPVTVRKPRKKKNTLPNMAALVATDGLLIFMCLADKIELGYGLVALAAASAILGARVRHATV